MPRVTGNGTSCAVAIIALSTGPIFVTTRAMSGTTAMMAAVMATTTVAATATRAAAGIVTVVEIVAAAMATITDTRRT